ncbi:DUF928 domain-containing protein [Ruegeria arenilitoris]|uniref:DUF928 domain-containing protein n=1 Tax=Ruegeria arenilitoris TaxID=1173585 RepID=UPI0014807F58|nr:DUF928 domain-containing protein [Ruegeria arenilitoris]
MISKRSIAIRCFFLSALSVLYFFASLPEATAQQSTNDQKSKTKPIVFKPPPNGVPADRVGAATRDIEQQDGILTLLVPKGGGLTTLQRPPLVWFVGETFGGQMHAQIARVGVPQNGAMKTSQSRYRKGYYALDLARSDFVLEPGVIYEWTVVLSDPQTGQVNSQVTSYVELTDGLTIESPEDITALAAEGLWFDALAPFVETELSGRVRIDENMAFWELISSAGLSLP